jgi:hypothetical protein
VPRLIGIFALAIVILGADYRASRRCEAQNRPAPEDFDYQSLAITSILSSAAEVSKLPDVPQRVRLMISAAGILPASHHDDAVRLLETALHDAKEWGLEDKASWYQRYTATSLRNEILAAYAVLDPQKAAAVQKESQAEAKSSTAESGRSLGQTADRRMLADQSAKMALAFVETDPDKAYGLIVQSCQGGTVSSVIVEIVQKLLQNGNRALLERIEMGVGRVLAENPTVDTSSINYAAFVILFDNKMSPAAKGPFVTYFMRSLQAWFMIIKEPGATVYNLAYGYSFFSENVRPIIVQSAPEQLAVLDLILDQVAPMVPENMKAIGPEKILDPRDRLNDILKEPNPEKRDRRLTSLVAQLIRSENPERNFDLAADAIAALSNPDAKSAYTDLLAISRVDLLVKQKKFIEAQQVASSISSVETRAWALLALSRVAAKADRVLGFELISNALRALDTASPSPHKVELALMATGMLAQSDPQRAFDTLSTVSRYANSSVAKTDPPTKPPFAFGLEATIGEARTRLGVYPESLGELKIDPSLSALATTDWFRSDYLASNIREPSLRLQLKLQLAGAILAQPSKPKIKEATPKPPVKIRPNT